MTSTPPPRSPIRLRVPPTPLHGSRYEHPLEQRTPRRTRRAQVGFDSLKESTRDRCTTPPPTVERSAIRHSPRFTARIKTKTITKTTTTTAKIEHATTGLPTPAKTPSKKNKQVALDASTARVLFPSSSRSRTGGFSIAGENPEFIPIYTDSNARIPKTAQNNEDPFAGTTPGLRRSKRRKVIVEEEEMPTEQGMWCTFRGRKVWKDFTTSQAAVKPRLLFPEARQAIEQEEEDTDVPSSPIHEDDDRLDYFLGQVDKDEKDKIGQVIRSPEKLSKVAKKTRTPRPKVRLQTPEPDVKAAFVNSLMTPPSTMRKKRSRPSGFPGDDEEEAEPNTPRADGRRLAKMRKLNFDEPEDMLRTPAKTPRKRVVFEEPNNEASGRVVNATSSVSD